MKSKVLLIIVTVVLLCGGVVGSTVAWLVSRSEVDNSFVAGNISIILTETTGESYPLLPGTTVNKDPKVTVRKGSEACWLFVKVEESADLDTYVSYTPADGWAVLQDGIYYREQAATAVDVTYSFLQNDQILIKDSVTEAQANALRATGEYPSLTLKAYAVQQSGIADVTQAWEKAMNLS